MSSYCSMTSAQRLFANYPHVSIQQDLTQVYSAPTSAPTDLELNWTDVILLPHNTRHNHKHLLSDSFEFIGAI